MTCEHRWLFIFSAGEDAPGKSLDTISHCSLCGAVKHDYAHGGGMTSPNYPMIYAGPPARPCALCERGLPCGPIPLPHTAQRVGSIGPHLVKQESHTIGRKKP